MIRLSFVDDSRSSSRLYTSNPLAALENTNTIIELIGEIKCLDRRFLIRPGSPYIGAACRRSHDVHPIAIGATVKRKTKKSAKPSCD